MYKDFYWILTDGRIIRPKQETLHCELVITHYKRFGFTRKQDAQDIYERSGRDEDSLRVPALNAGHLRLRNHARHNAGWTLQCLRFSNTQLAHVQNCLRKEKVDLFLPVTLKNALGTARYTGFWVDFVPETQLNRSDRAALADDPRRASPGQRSAAHQKLLAACAEFG